MAKDMEQIRKKAQTRGGMGAGIDDEQQKEVLFELRRQLFKAQSEIRTLTTENDVMRGTDSHKRQ